MSVPKLFSNQDDMLARSTVETWVIKAEPGEQVRLLFFFIPGKSKQKYAKFVFVRRTAAPNAAARFSRLRRWSQPL